MRRAYRFDLRFDFLASKREHKVSLSMIDIGYRRSLISVKTETRDICNILHGGIPSIFFGQRLRKARDKTDLCRLQRGNKSGSLQ